MIDLGLAAFARALSEAKPTPGGGAAAAYAGALGAALAGMTLGYARKHGASGNAARIEEGWARMEALREALLDLTRADGEAYGAYVAARDLSREDREARRRRKAAVTQALEQALSVPHRGAHRSLEGLEELAAYRDLVPSALAPDLGVSARLFHAAFHSCWYNVEVNARLLGDEERVAALRRERAQGVRRVDELLAVVLERVESGGAP